MIRPLVEQHALEVSFLWSLRSLAVGEPHYRLRDLEKLDVRIDAHLDGLREAGGEGWEILNETLPMEDAGDLFAAGILAIDRDTSTRLARVLEAAERAPETAEGLVAAFGWIPHDRVASLIASLLESGEEAAMAVGIGAATSHRQDPGPALKTALAFHDPVFRGRAYRAVGEIGRPDLIGSFWSGYHDVDPEVRYWACWAGATLAEMNGVDRLRDLATQDPKRRDDAVRVALRFLEHSAARRWHRELVASPNWHRQALVGAGVVGDAELVPWLIESMALPEVARVAGEALSMISGVDIEDEGLEADVPALVESVPSDDPADERVELDPDENLPWPDPVLTREWWQTRKVGFSSGVPYLCGRPLALDSAQHVLKEGFQRQRAAAALELRVHRRTEPLFSTTAPAARQRSALMACTR